LLRPDPTDPADMTVNERLAEIASFLARGILRLRGRFPAHPTPAAPPSESAGILCHVP